MASSTFCSVCQRKNKVDSQQCEFCGADLQTESSEIGLHTTLNIAPAIEPRHIDSLCQEHVSRLEKGDVCFLIEEKQTPIIVEQASEIIIGRFFDPDDSRNLDLDPFGGGAHGVSRRHAQIIRVVNKYVIEDLNSTSGSWLNVQRIPSGTTYPLTSGDEIWLGQFKMQVCFQQTETIPNTILFLRDPTITANKLTLMSLLTKFGPYLKAISDLQDIAATCLQLKMREVTIEKIDATESDVYIVVHIADEPEAIHLIRKWITPWRFEHLPVEENLIEDHEYKQAIVQLTSKIILDIAANMSNEARFTVTEKALPIVTELATGPIESSFR